MDFIAFPMQEFRTATTEWVLSAFLSDPATPLEVTGLLSALFAMLGVLVALLVALIYIARTRVVPAMRRVV